MGFFDWGYGGDQAQGQPQSGGTQPQMSPDAMLYDALRQSQTTSFLSPQKASDIAQNDSGLGIQNVKRGFGYAYAPMPSTVYAGVGLNGWKQFPTATVSVQLSGRPVMVFIKGVLHLLTSTAYEAQVEARVDGSASGFIVPCWTQIFSSADASSRPCMPFSAWGVCVPTAGSHTFTMWADAGTNNVEITSSSSYPHSIAVVEI